MDPDSASAWEVLATREESSMASMWEEHLCIRQVGPGQFELATCGYELLDSIYSAVPEDELYDEKGEFRVPETYMGKRIIGLCDNEYLMTDELTATEVSEVFGDDSVELAREFCDEQGWASLNGLELATQAMKRSGQQ